jgi:hypothetical protein
MSIKTLSRKQVAHLRDRGTVSVKKTLSDTIAIPAGESTRFKDAKGNLTFGMDICRDGIQEYLAEEIFESDLLRENDIAKDTIIRVWRPPDVVFNPDAIKSHNGRPMTRNHPDMWVDAGNRIMLEKGIARDCWYNKEKAVVSGTGFVTDAPFVSEIEAKKFTDISDGYDSDLDFEPGVVPDSVGAFPCTNSGDTYDMIMRSYSPNHIAIVPEGRAGNAKILDHGIKGGTMKFWENLFKKNVLGSMTDEEKIAALTEDEEDPDKKAVLESIGKKTSDASIVGGYNDIEVPEFNTSGAAVSEAAARKAVLTPDGGINRVIHGIKDANGKPVKVIRQIDAVVSVDDPTPAPAKPTKEVENMQIDEETIKALKDIVSEALEERLGGGSSAAVGGSDISATGHAEPDDDEYIGDDEAASIGVAEEFPDGSEAAEPAPAAGNPAAKTEDAVDPAESIKELLKNPELSPKSKAALEEALAGLTPPAPAPTADAELTGVVTPDSLQKLASGSDDPETKRMAMALAEKIAMPKSGADAEPDKPALDPTEVTDGEPDEEKDGYRVPKKIADSDGARAKLLLDSISLVKAYGITGIDTTKHVQDGTIYHRIIDASGILGSKKLTRVTRPVFDMAVGAISANRPMIDGMSAALSVRARDAQSTAGKFNPGENY